VIANVRKNFGSLVSDVAPREIINCLAVYLSEFPGITIDYNGTIIDPAEARRRYDDLALDDVELSDGRKVGVKLTVIEWKEPQERALYLCDSSGISLHQVSPGIHAPASISRLI